MWAWFSVFLTGLCLLVPVQSLSQDSSESEETPKKTEKVKPKKTELDPNEFVRPSFKGVSMGTRSENVRAGHKDGRSSVAVGIGEYRAEWEKDDSNTFLLLDQFAGLRTTVGEDYFRESAVISHWSEEVIRMGNEDDKSDSGLYRSTRFGLHLDIPVVGKSDDPEVSSAGTEFEVLFGAGLGWLHKDRRSGDLMQLGLCLDGVYRAGNIEEDLGDGFDLRATTIGRASLPGRDICEWAGGRFLGEFEGGQYLDSGPGDDYLRAGVRWDNGHVGVFGGFLKDDRGLGTSDAFVLSIMPSVLVGKKKGRQRRGY